MLGKLCRSRCGRDARNRRQRGVTMIELLVVIAIIGVLAAVVLPMFGPGVSTTELKGAARQVAAGLRLARSEAMASREERFVTLDLYKLETGRYPTTQEGLQALVSAPAGVTNWNGPYWKKTAVPKDPWGNDYRYTSPGQNNTPYEIASYGADGKEGGEGANKDITTSQ